MTRPPPHHSDRSLTASHPLPSTPPHSLTQLAHTITFLCRRHSSFPLLTVTPSGSTRQPLTALPSTSLSPSSSVSLMFPVPRGSTEAAAERYGEVKKAQEERVDEQEHPEEAAKAGDVAKASQGEDTGKAPADKKADEDAGTKELLKAVHNSTLTHM